MDVRQYYKNFLTLFSGNVLSQLLPFIIAPTISRLYSPEEIGTYSNFFAIVSMLGIIAAGRFELAIPIATTKERAQNLVFTGVVFTFIITAISTLFPIFSSSIEQFYNDPQLGKILWLIPVSVFFYGIMLVLTNWFLRLKAFKAISINKIILAAVNNGSTVLIGLLKANALVMALSWLIGQVTGFIILLFKLNKNHGRPKSDFSPRLLKTTIAEHKDFPLINSLHAFMDIFATQFLLFWIITKTFGNYEFGIYALMFKYIRGPISLVTSSVSQLFYVETSQAMNEKKPIKHIFSKTMKMSTLFGIGFSLVVILFGQKLFSIYFGEKWAAGGLYAQCILPILFLTFVVSPVSGMTILFRKQLIGFLLSLACYTFSIFAFVIGITFKWSFEQSLVLYSAVYSLYFITIIIWYRHLIRKYEESIAYV